MMPISSYSHLTQTATHFGSGAETSTAERDLAAYGLQGSLSTEIVGAVREILENHFQGVNFKELTAPLTQEQVDALNRLARLGVFDANTVHHILGQSDAATPQVPDLGGPEEGAGSAASSGSRDAPQSRRSLDGELDRAERGDNAHNGGGGAVVDQGVPGRGFFGALSAAGRAIGNQLPHATPAVMDVVCLGLSATVAGLAIKQVIQESGKPNHDSTLLFMKATLPAVVAFNSLRNLIKYGTDGQRV